MAERDTREKKAPISYRAGSAIGRNLDTVSGLGGALAGGAAGARLAMDVDHPAALLAVPAGAGLGYLGGRTTGRFLQGLTSGKAHAYGDTSKAASIHPAIVRSFVAECGRVKEALSLAQLKTMGQLAGGGVKRMAPGGKALSVSHAAPKAVAKSTQRGVSLPGVADMRRDYQSVQSAGQQLAGSKSLMGAPPVALMRG